MVLSPVFFWRDEQRNQKLTLALAVMAYLVYFLHLASILMYVITKMLRYPLCVYSINFIFSQKIIEMYDFL